MNPAATLAGDRRRLAACLLAAASFHALVVLTIDVPERGARSPMPIDIVLAPPPGAKPPGTPADESPAEGTPPESVASNKAVARAARLADAGPAIAEDAAQSQAKEPDVPPHTDHGVAAARPDPTAVLDGTTGDLARAITAQARLTSTEANSESTPRTRRLTGSPSGDPELAYYLDSWRRKVERVGNINYPSEARARGISGTLRLLVVIEPTGQLKDVQVLASSGHALLDNGALRIVNLAAPFSPFTTKMRANIDQLEIERTWRFQKDRLTPVP